MVESRARTEEVAKRLYWDCDQATAIFGRFGVVIWRGETTLAAVDRVREMGLELVRQSPPRCIIGVVEETTKIPSADARKQSAKVNDELAEMGVVGYAGVMPRTGFSGAWIRGVITALHLMARKPYPFRVFESSGEACSWLVSMLGDPNINPKTVTAAIELFRKDYAKAWTNELSQGSRSGSTMGESNS
jgi:hypothetical protein